MSEIWYPRDTEKVLEQWMEDWPLGPEARDAFDVHRASQMHELQKEEYASSGTWCDRRNCTRMGNV